MPKERVPYIDNLRILLIILVILFNLALLYGSPLDKRPYHGSQPPGKIESIIESNLYLSFLAVTESFFMGFFFMISGYFTPGSYDRKGAWPFLKDRLLRLGIPLLFYIVFIHPALGYVIALSTTGFTGSFLDFLALYIRNYSVLGSGPLWFLEALLIFNGAYVLWRGLAKRVYIGVKILENKTIAIFALMLGLTTFILRIWFPLGSNFAPLNFEIPLFPQYIALFIVGLIAYRSNWQLPKSTGGLWSRVSVILLMLFPFLNELYMATGNPIQRYGGFHWQALTYAMWEQFIGIAIIITLLNLFREKYNTQGRLLESMSKSSYTVYIIHVPIIIFLALSLQEIAMNPLLKLALVAFPAVAVCFLVGNCVRKLPIVRKVV